MSSSFRSVTYETSSAGSGSGHDVEDQDDDEAGIGICLVQQKGKFIIDSLDPGGAAEKSGNVLVGDVITQIEGISVFGKKQQEVSDLLLGPCDTLVEMEIERGSNPATRLSAVVRRLEKSKAIPEGGHAHSPGRQASGAGSMGGLFDVGPSSSRGSMSQDTPSPKRGTAVSEENAKLASENESLRSQNLDLLGKLAALRREKEEGDEERVALSKSKAELEQQVERLAEELAAAHAAVAEEASIDPSVYVGGRSRRRNSKGRDRGGKGGGGAGAGGDEVGEEDSFDPSEYYGAGEHDDDDDDDDDGRSDASFDPSEWQEGTYGTNVTDSGSDVGDGGDESKCGVGITLVEDEGGFRVISVTHGGPADRLGAIVVGDVLVAVEDECVVGKTKGEVLSLLRGRAGSKVGVRISRGGADHSVVLERDLAETRAWQLLSQYSQAHPEDFKRGRRGDRNSRGSTASMSSADDNPVDTMRRTLETKNEEIMLLRAHLAEAEAGKDGMLDRINQLLSKAQHEVVATQSPAKAEEHEAEADGQDVGNGGAGGGGHSRDGGGAKDGWPGVQFEVDDEGTCRVSNVIERSNAGASRKVHAGDMLLYVDNVPTSSVKECDEIASKLVGAVGSSVVLGLQRVNAQGLLYLSHVSVERCGLASVPPIGGVIVTNAGDAGASASSKAATPAGVKCSVGLLVKKDSKGGLKVRGFASGGPAERCGKIKVGMWLTYVDGAPVKGLQYTRLADLMQGEAGSKVTLTLVEKVGETPKSMQVVLVREPPREAVSVSHGRVRRMEAEAIDPVAAENALKNAQASAMARTMAMESREQQNTVQGPGSAHQEDDGGAEMVRGSEREMGRDGEAAEGGVDDEKRAWGVGIEFELDAYGNVLAKSVSQSCHAGRGGLAFAGDILKAVGGTAVKGLTIAEVDDLVRGEAGSEVRLSLQRHKRGMVSLLLNREVAVGRTPPPQPTCGVGITFKLRKDGLYHVKALAEGGPAAMSGYINIGDIIVSVDGVSIQGHTHQELAALVLGVDATPVDLVTLYRLPDGTMRPSSVRLYRAAIAATTSSGAAPALSQPSSTGSASTSSLSSLPTPPASAGNVYKFAPAPRTEAGDKGDDGAGDWAEKPAAVARMSV